MNQQWDHEVETFAIVDGTLPEEARQFLEGRGLVGWEVAAITTIEDHLLMIVKRPRGWVPPDDAASGRSE